MSTTFNTHAWREMVLEGRSTDDIIEATWDGIGDKETARKVLNGEPADFYTFADAGLVEPKKEGFGL